MATPKMKVCLTEEELNKLSPAEQRVEIAKDVLDMIYTGKLLASQGHYMNSTLPWMALQDRANDEGLDSPSYTMLFRDFFREGLQKQEEEGKGNPVASVCAIGGIFLAAVDKFDSLQCSDLGFRDADDDEMLEYLQRWFTDEELRTIEAAFEGSWCGSDEQLDNLDAQDDSQVQGALAFCDDDDTPHDRMAMIMHNIVNNKGAFLP